MEERQEVQFDELIINSGDVLVSYFEEKLKIKEDCFFQSDYKPQVIVQGAQHITIIENKLFNEIQYLRGLISEIKNKKESFILKENGNKEK